MTVKAVIHEADEGGYWAEVPSIPGCVSQGESFEELLSNIREAVAACLAVDDGADPQTGADRVIEIVLRREGTHMEYTAVIKQSGDWWIGWIEEVPGVNCQERTREELRESLASALSEILELNRKQALAAAGDDYQEEKVIPA